MVLDKIAAALEALGPQRLTRPHTPTRGAHLDVTVAPGQVRAFARAVRGHGFLIEDVTAVDATPEMMVVYHFAHPAQACRVQGRVLVDRSEPQVPSIREIFPGADWHERETHDFFGVVFQGHPDLTPFILPEESAGLKPLLKGEKNIKALGAVVPEFGAPAAEGEAAAPKPRPPKRDKAPAAEGDA